MGIEIKEEKITKDKADVTWIWDLNSHALLAYLKNKF